MTRRFKKGDRVRRVSGCDFIPYGIFVGNEYTVRYAKDNALKLEDIGSMWLAKYFEHVHSTTPGELLQTITDLVGKLLRPLPIRVGDVYETPAGKRYTVLGLHKNSVWLDRVNGEPFTTFTSVVNTWYRKI